MSRKLGSPDFIRELPNGVLSAVEFNDELPGGTSKIDNASADGVLAAKAMFDW